MRIKRFKNLQPQPDPCYEMEKVPDVGPQPTKFNEKRVVIVKPSIIGQAIEDLDRTGYHSNYHRLQRYKSQYNPKRRYRSRKSNQRIEEDDRTDPMKPYDTDNERLDRRFFKNLVKQMTTINQLDDNDSEFLTEKARLSSANPAWDDEKLNEETEKSLGRKQYTTQKIMSMSQIFTSRNIKTNKKLDELNKAVKSGVLSTKKDIASGISQVLGELSATARSLDDNITKAVQSSNQQLLNDINTSLDKVHQALMMDIQSILPQTGSPSGSPLPSGTTPLPSVQFRETKQALEELKNLAEENKVGLAENKKHLDEIIKRIDDVTVSSTDISTQLQNVQNTIKRNRQNAINFEQSIDKSIDDLKLEVKDIAKQVSNDPIDYSKLAQAISNLNIIADKTDFTDRLFDLSNVERNTMASIKFIDTVIKKGIVNNIPVIHPKGHHQAKDSIVSLNEALRKKAFYGDWVEGVLIHRKVIEEYKENLQEKAPPGYEDVFPQFFSKDPAPQQGSPPAPQQGSPPAPQQGSPPAPAPQEKKKKKKKKKK